MATTPTIYEDLVYELRYFPFRGRAEKIRLLLEEAGVPYIDVPVTNWEDVKHKYVLGKLPVLVEIVPAKPGQLGGQSEIVIPQSNAIVRHLGRTFGLVGKDEDELVKVDYILDQVADWTAARSSLTSGQKEPAKEKYVNEVLLQQAQIFEKLLEVNGSGFFVGGSLTIADVNAWDCINVSVEWLGEGWLEGFPLLKKFYRNFSTRLRIAAYINSPRRRPPDLVG